MREEHTPNEATPIIEKAIKLGRNVLLESPHGVGKTYIVDDIAKRLGYKMVSYDAVLTDVFLEIIGLPEIVDNDKGDRELRFVRKQEIMEAEIIFFDEFSRGTVEMHNAIFSLMQFGRANDVEFKNLKSVVCAQNPANSIYHGTRPLDPALADRFHHIIRLRPVNDVNFIAEKLGNLDVANALIAWSNTINHEVNYVSPRRLVDIGKAFIDTGDREFVETSLPMEGDFDVEALWNALTLTCRDYDESNLNDIRNGNVIVDEKFISENAENLIDSIPKIDSGVAEKISAAISLFKEPKNIENILPLVQKVVKMTGRKIGIVEDKVLFHLQIFVNANGDSKIEHTKDGVSYIKRDNGLIAPAITENSINAFFERVM